MKNKFEENEKFLLLKLEFVKKSVKKYSPEVATTLINLGVLYLETKEFDKALEKYKEVLQIYRKLAEEQEEMYLPYVVEVLANFSIFYLLDKPNKEKSISYAKEALEISKQFSQVLSVKHYSKISSEVLEANGVNLEEI